jgi:hypothetical protein
MAKNSFSLPWFWLAKIIGSIFFIQSPLLTKKLLRLLVLIVH